MSTQTGPARAQTDEEWALNQELHKEMVQSRMSLENLERAAAYKAVSEAVSSYRWWHPSSLLTSFRLWLQARRQR